MNNLAKRCIAAVGAAPAVRGGDSSRSIEVNYDASMFLSSLAKTITKKKFESTSILLEFSCWERNKVVHGEKSNLPSDVVEGAGITLLEFQRAKLRIHSPLKNLRPSCKIRVVLVDGCSKLNVNAAIFDGHGCIRTGAISETSWVE
ncbi:hypothetical protein PanWU01x14_026780 [Parasponia andersonii]|uniref:Uncharacterized protein n=1 Tax=Parasponia andersonii TaxID=3476 RepID=A0A2P5DW48_PARAD|nr:hypothetical protein PanWU01x14_026780 [Parasponia andersonii]